MTTTPELKSSGSSSKKRSSRESTRSVASTGEKKADKKTVSSAKSDETLTEKSKDSQPTDSEQQGPNLQRRLKSRHLQMIAIGMRTAERLWPGSRC